MIVASLVLARRGSCRAGLVWLGTLGYGVYNYAFYLFGAALNVFFPLYVAAVVTSVLALILALSRVDVVGTAASFSATTPVRLIGGYFLLVATGLTAAWTGMWAGYVFARRTLPVAPQEFQLVPALDLTLMVPALATGGVRRCATESRRDEAAMVRWPSPGPIHIFASLGPNHSREGHGRP